MATARYGGYPPSNDCGTLPAGDRERLELCETRIMFNAGHILSDRFAVGVCFDLVPLDGTPMSATAQLAWPSSSRSTGLLEHFARVRATTLALCEGLYPEDTVVQSMPDTSPTKWHLAHTTWFFEQFVLGRDPAYVPLHLDWMVLFNSYYQTVGPMHPRAQRGHLSRPGLHDIIEYRRRIDERMQALLQRDLDAEIANLVTLGLNHEQQHQELILTDIKHLFAQNPLEPVYRRAAPAAAAAAVPVTFIRGREGIVQIGSEEGVFAFDNETPRHASLLHPHAIANRVVTNAEYAEFVRDGGYQTPSLWMAEGWNIVRERDWRHPLYWSDSLETEFTLGGRISLQPHAPVCHVSFYEADAFARWAGNRLPTEAEWECAAADAPIQGNLLESGRMHPQPAVAGDDGALLQLFGDVWEWTSSPYVNYPGYEPLAGALGEYNGKFMCGQWVLRGGSCATPAEHIRATYRNFFYPHDRWQFMGIRLGKDA
jgi:ergothioneine biosynthesis protein EgtB